MDTRDLSMLTPRKMIIHSPTEISSLDWDFRLFNGFVMVTGLNLMQRSLNCYGPTSVSRHFQLIFTHRSTPINILTSVERSVSKFTVNEDHRWWNVRPTGSKQYRIPGLKGCMDHSTDNGFTGQMPKTRSLHQSYQWRTSNLACSSGS